MLLGSFEGTKCSCMQFHLVLVVLNKTFQIMPRTDSNFICLLREKCTKFDSLRGTAAPKIYTNYFISWTIFMKHLLRTFSKNYLNGKLERSDDKIIRTVSTTRLSHVLQTLFAYSFRYKYKKYYHCRMYENLLPILNFETDVSL